MQYPRLQGLLFAVPNGGSRNAIEAAKLKREGVVAGVSDLILLKASGGLTALCIEIKTHDAKSKQTKLQKEWEDVVTEHGARYVVCRDVGEFIEVVTGYLKSEKTNN